MAKPRNVIQLSFKNEGDEYELFTFLKTKLNASAFIKETLWDLYKHKGISLDTTFAFMPPGEDSVLSTAQQQTYNSEATIAVSESVEEAKEDLFEENIERPEPDDW